MPMNKTQRSKALGIAMSRCSVRLNSSNYVLLQRLSHECRSADELCNRFNEYTIPGYLAMTSDEAKPEISECEKTVQELDYVEVVDENEEATSAEILTPAESNDTMIGSAEIDNDSKSVTQSGKTHLFLLCCGCSSMILIDSSEETMVLLPNTYQGIYKDAIALTTCNTCRDRKIGWRPDVVNNNGSWTRNDKPLTVMLHQHLIEDSSVHRIANKIVGKNTTIITNKSHVAYLDLKEVMAKVTIEDRIRSVKVNACLADPTCESVNPYLCGGFI